MHACNTSTTASSLMSGRSPNSSLQCIRQATLLAEHGHRRLDGYGPAGQNEQDGLRGARSQQQGAVLGLHILLRRQQCARACSAFHSDGAPGFSQKLHLGGPWWSAPRKAEAQATETESLHAQYSHCFTRVGQAAPRNKRTAPPHTADTAACLCAGRDTAVAAGARR